MSNKDLVGFLEEKLLPAFHANDTSFDESVQEEYLTPEGWLNKQYICRSLKLHMSTASFRKAVKLVFDVAEFTLLPVENEVSEELFNKHYKFGEFSDVTGWIGYFYGFTGKVLTREKLFNYVLNSEQSNNGIHFWGHGLRPIKQLDIPYEPSRLFS